MPETLDENILFKHVTMDVRRGKYGLLDASALVLKCIRSRNDGARADGWRMTMTGDEAIQFVWTVVGMGINGAGGAVTITVAVSTN